MKKRDYLLILSIVVIAGVIWILTSLLFNEAGGSLKITVDGQEYGVYSLDRDQDISIEDTNVCQIRDEKVSMITADCPDKVCVHSADIYKQGQTIICMPNKVVLEIIDGEMGIIDTIAE